MENTEGLKEKMDGFQTRIGRAVALARAMGAAFQDQAVHVHTVGGEIDAMDGLLGIADLLDAIRDDMVNMNDA